MRRFRRRENRSEASCWRGICRTCRISPSEPGRSRSPWPRPRMRRLETTPGTWWGSGCSFTSPPRVSSSRLRRMRRLPLTKRMPRAYPRPNLPPPHPPHPRPNRCPRPMLRPNPWMTSRGRRTLRRRGRGRRERDRRRRSRRHPRPSRRLPRRRSPRRVPCSSRTSWSVARWAMPPRRRAVLRLRCAVSLPTSPNVPRLALRLRPVSLSPLA
mmetsp:Transcript_9810/g.42758  ORF Transcript_9810/g.42758 Transcript_9810/m.42758 type:complete len:212 (+) Transcript_9810:2669-3304(+)